MKRKNVVYIGSALILIGLFMPIVDAPLVGSYNYVGLLAYDAMVLGALALVAALLAKRSYFKGVTVCGALAMTFIAFDLIQVVDRLSQARGTMVNAGIAKSFSIEWGWLPLVAGALIFLTLNTSNHLFHAQEKDTAKEARKAARRSKD